ncbi:hypothetical protein HNR23_003648 [Nocardiopsis mwathae]|uniref:DUF6879 domain-containing protein n=1 Tax=Nocardiopsis mwathae TaxID=1472723 RepID=A0A7W9YK11_9ACTN|nr:hypothetical protein [Nocardiopsis mwathae]
MAPYITGDAFTDLFRNYRYTAWRLETRTYYGKVNEDQPFQEWLAGKDPGIDFLKPWLRMVRDETATGKRMQRVRIIDNPPSDYLKWELWATPYNNAAGEDIRYLPREHPIVAELPDHDFWVFDSKTVCRLHFDDDNMLLGATLSEDPQELLAALRARDAAWHHALTYLEYMATRFE